MRLIAVAALAVTAASVPAHAASVLEWAATAVTLEAAPLDEEAVGVFKFTNTGNRAVTIREARADCGCTVPTLEKKIYAPGESGELRAVFTFGERTGRQQKIITVVTDEPGAPAHALEFTVTIPQLFEVAPWICVWRRGDAREPKTITIRARHPEVVRPVAAEVRDARFAARLEPAAGEPGAFTLTVTPPAGDEDTQTAIVVTTNEPAETPRVITVYARVF